MTADARVLQFPTAVGVGDYGRFSRELSDDELAGCFFFTDDDRVRIAVRRSEMNRLGFALQLGTVRYLGRFLENPVEVPASVLGWTARELAVPLSVSLVEYGQGRTRFDHQAEICDAYGYRPLDTAGVEREFVGWLRARAWVSAESQRALFAGAAEHLIGLRVLLPGHSTLWRLVASARERADARGYSMLTEVVTDEQRDRLLELLRTPAGRRLSTLERLRRPIVDPSIKGLIGGLDRERELRMLAEGLGGLDALPVARLRTLMVDAERQRCNVGYTPLVDESNPALREARLRYVAPAPGNDRRRKRPHRRTARQSRARRALGRRRGRLDRRAAVRRPPQNGVAPSSARNPTLSVCRH